jgi:hypothetical protein
MPTTKKSSSGILASSRMRPPRRSSRGMAGGRARLPGAGRRRPERPGSSPGSVVVLGRRLGSRGAYRSVLRGDRPAESGARRARQPRDRPRVGMPS